MRLAFPYVACVSALGVAAAIAACGPSFQALYEGDARFEHCYALEETGSATMQQKSECWRDWTQHYTYGQTRDRVEYAVARYRALTRVPEAPTDEAMMAAAPGEGRGAAVAAPAPTSAFAPPPKTLAEMDGGTPDAALPGYVDAAARPVVKADEAQPPASECSDGCTTNWNGCREHCDAAKTCDECSVRYKRCMKQCFSR